MINARLDIKRITEHFQRRGRIHIGNFFEPGYAEQLRACLENDVPWEGCTYGPNAPPPEEIHGLSESAKASLAQLGKRLEKDEKTGIESEYSFYFYRYVIPGGQVELLSRFHHWISTDPGVMKFINTLSRAERIDSASANAFVYRPGCFLNVHNDAQPEEKPEYRRMIAYSIGLTPEWRPDWGGYLNILDSGMNLIDVFPVRFNSISFFKVPVWHFVQPVASYAKRDRYTITGWFQQKTA